jgi:hypothetical protein
MTATGAIATALATPPGSCAQDAQPNHLTPGAEEDALSDELWPQPVEAELWLAEYRINYAHLMPFVAIPTAMTAQELQANKPLFWKAVMLAACQYDGPRQMAMGRVLHRELAEATMMKPQRGLDLLQAMQMLIWW